MKLGNDSVVSQLDRLINDLDLPDLEGELRGIHEQFIKTHSPPTSFQEFNEYIGEFTRLLISNANPIRRSISLTEAKTEAVRILNQSFPRGGYQGSFELCVHAPETSPESILLQIAGGFAEEVRKSVVIHAYAKNMATKEQRLTITKEILEKYRDHLPQAIKDAPTWAVAVHVHQLIQMVQQIEQSLRTPDLPF